MELRQLQYLLTVVEEGGFTRAADRLYLAQPGLSAQIRQLERELGQPLLDRTGGRVTATEAGEAVLLYARAALAAVEGIRRTADEFAGLVRGHVTLGVASGAATGGHDLPALLADFHEEHPGVEFSVIEDTSVHMLTALRRGELDLALLGVTEDELPPGIGFQIVADTPLVAAMPPGDPLLDPVGRAALPLAALADRPLLTLIRGTGIRGALEHACRQAGFRPRIAFEAASPGLLARFAARGLGVAVLPEMPSETTATLGLRTLPLTSPGVRGRIALVWPADGPTTPAAKALLRRARKAFPPVAPAAPVAP
ncbi:LysR family transcriptional regulator [Streptomyces lichenis]|uniref:LysR family transcriptional regulator n=1 Tax=Streptomyces lichenis TaxID=2306967 RepID=A0ABT0ID13_9ACTN|nr:LysR family transcriptional regulator [Streptomyces lichenis]MCK8679222.1 LysR family transcriptional regulator [Streptomyces lichenis]